jgi:hypothetical protein
VGQEVRCRVAYADTEAECRAMLEPEELWVRGAIRLTIPFAEIRHLEAKDGDLVVELDSGMLVLGLGARAPRWAERIRNPRTLLDKLGVKPGMRVSVLDVEDGAFDALLTQRDADVAHEPRPETDVVFLGVETAVDLTRIAGLRRAIRADGAIWVISPRGRSDLREIDVLEAGRAGGLVDTKVARFSDTRTAHRFVIPKARR